MKNLVKSILVQINVLMIIGTIMINDFSSFTHIFWWFVSLLSLSALNMKIYRNSSKKDRNEYLGINFYNNLTK